MCKGEGEGEEGALSWLGLGEGSAAEVCGLDGGAREGAEAHGRRSAPPRRRAFGKECGSCVEQRPNVVVRRPHDLTQELPPRRRMA
jgi:hypothetical protein